MNYYLLLDDEGKHDFCLYKAPSGTFTYYNVDLYYDESMYTSISLSEGALINEGLMYPELSNHLYSLTHGMHLDAEHKAALGKTRRIEGDVSIYIDSEENASYVISKTISYITDYTSFFG